jgi:hypothetical protein
MLADMKAKKYCLHPGKLRVKVPERRLREDGELGEPTGKTVMAWEIISANDLIEKYGVDKELCVTWGRACVGHNHLIHLFPDREGRYELPRDSGLFVALEAMETPARGSRKSKSKK